MKFNLKNNIEVAKFQYWSKKVIDSQKLIEVKTKLLKRTLDQNALLWLWMEFVSITMSEYGDNKPKEFWYCYFMDIFPIFFNETAIRKTSSLYDIKEMTYFLNQIDIHTKTEWGFDLPNPDDKRLLEYFEQFGYKLDKK